MSKTAHGTASEVNRKPEPDCPPKRSAIGIILPVFVTALQGEARLKAAARVLGYFASALQGASATNDAAEGGKLLSRVGKKVLDIVFAGLVPSLPDLAELMPEFDFILCEPSPEVVDALIHELLESAAPVAEDEVRAEQEHTLAFRLVLMRLWSFLLQDRFDRLPPMLAADRMRNDPFYEIVERLDQPWTGTGSELQKAAWVCQMLAELIEQSVVAEEDVTPADKPRAQLPNYLRRADIRRFFPKLGQPEVDRVARRLLYAHQHAKIQAKETEEAFRDGTGQRAFRPCYWFAADAVQCEVSRQVGKRKGR